MITLKKLTAEKANWKHQDDVDFPYFTEINNKKYEIHVNDFPDDPLYSVFASTKRGRIFLGDINECKNWKFDPLDWKDKIDEFRNEQLKNIEFQIQR